jgi:transaldolase / glucose-6-phosphate isomerase
MSSANAVFEKERLSLILGSEIEQALSESIKDWDSQGNSAKLWNKESSLWPGAVKTHDLAWLDIAANQLRDISKFKALAAEIHEDGFSHLILLGPSKSSRLSEVFVQAFEPRPGFPELVTLDAIDLDQVKKIRETINLSNVLFCLANEDGMTLEMQVWTQYFYSEIEALSPDAVGKHFIAITAEGSDLDRFASAMQFRRIHHAGHSFSALSDYGLVPYAIAGLDTEQLLKRAASMAEVSSRSQTAQNPSILLGLALATFAKRFQRNKATIICSDSLGAFGAWLEQLLSDATNDEEKGLIAVNGEPVFSPESYGADRFFIYVRYVADDDRDQNESVSRLQDAGYPVVRMVWDDLDDLGSAFVQWEVAAIVACSVLKINPFNFPKTTALPSDASAVQGILESKVDDSPKAEAVHLDQDNAKVFFGTAFEAITSKHKQTTGAIVRRLLDSIRPDDYFGILSYLPRSEPLMEMLRQIRKEVAENRRIVTLLHFTPQSLHSRGVFLQLTCEDEWDLPLTKAPYSLGRSKALQAQREFQKLDSLNSRILRVHLHANVELGMNRLRDLVFAALAH